MMTQRVKEIMMTQRVKEIMSRGSVIVHVDHSLSAAARRMTDFGIGALPVVDSDELVGIATDRVPVIRGLAQGADSRHGDDVRFRGGDAASG